MSGGRKEGENKRFGSWRGREKGAGEEKEGENRRQDYFISFFFWWGVCVVLHSSVLESVQASACVGRVTTDSDRS